MKVIERPADFLERNGVLFEINRQVLHPLGLELHFEHDPDGEVKGMKLLDNREASDPIFFSADEFERGRRRYEEYMAEHGRRNIQKRRQIGMVIQTGPNLPHHIHDGDGE